MKRPRESSEQDDREGVIEALQMFTELKESWPAEMSELFSEGLSQEARDNLFSRAIDDAADCCDQYAWVLPDARALRILDHFAPIVEIGAGAGYWAHCMHCNDTEVTAYDRHPPCTLSGKPRQKIWAEVKDGGPEVLALDKHRHDALFLCYPDDYEQDSASLAAECLDVFQGDTVVHAGELFGDTPLLDAAPWGRTSGADFQQRLFSDFRCVLKVPLPRFPHTADFLTVWRRARTCCVHLDAVRAVASTEDAAVVRLSGSGGAGSASEASDHTANSDSRDVSGMEFVCDFDQFISATVAVGDGTAVAPLQHLL